MDRKSRIPGGIPRPNTGQPCRIPSAPNRSGVTREGQFPPGIRRVLEVPDLVHRAPPVVPRYRPQTSPVAPRRPSVIPTAASSVGGTNTVSRISAPCPAPAAASGPVSNNTSLADRKPRVCPTSEASGVQRIGNVTGAVSCPRAGAIPAPRSMPRPTAPGASGIVRPNTFSGARGMTGGVGIPRPGGNVSALPRMPAPTVTTQSAGVVRPSSYAGAGGVARTGGVPRTGGIPGAAGAAKPIYSMAGPVRPCQVVTGPAGEPREATMTAPRPMALPEPRAGTQQHSSTMPTLMPQPGARLRFNAPGSFIRPPAMQMPGSMPRRGLPRPQFSAGPPRMPMASGPCGMPRFAGDVNASVGSGLRPPIPQGTIPTVSFGAPMASSTARYQSQLAPRSPVNIPPRRASPGVGGDIVDVTRPMDTSRLISPMQTTRTMPDMFEAAETFPPLASPLKPTRVQRSPCPLREMSPAQVQRSPCQMREMSLAQVQRSPCQMREMSPAQVQRSPCQMREMSPAQVQRSPCQMREMSPAQVQRSPCQMREMSPAQVQCSPCQMREISPAQVQRSPCPIRKTSPARDFQSQSPRTAMAEPTRPCPDEPSPSRQEVSSTPCRRQESTPSPPVVPPDECLSPVHLQSPSRSQDTSRMFSGQSDIPSFMKPPSRKRQRQMRRESLFYSKRPPPFSSPRLDITPRAERIQCRMPSTVSTGPSPVPFTSPSPPGTYSPSCPFSTDLKSSPRTFSRSPPGRPQVMEGTVRLSNSKRVCWADGQPGLHPGTVTVDRWGDGCGGSGTESVLIEQDPYDWDSSGSPPRVPEELLCPDEPDVDSYQTPPTARLRYRPSRFRPRRDPSAKIKRFQETPLSYMPMKDHGRYEPERMFPQSHWRKLTDIYEEKGDDIERGASPAVCPEGPPTRIPEGAPCPPDGPPDSWSEEEDECSQEVDSGEGVTAKSRTKVRTVTKEWADPQYKYSSSIRNTETVEILLSPPDEEDAEGECPRVDDECDAGGEAEVDAAAAAADECHRMAEEAAARAREAAETASRMAMEVERAASRCSPCNEEEGAEGGVTDGELEEMRRLLNEEKAEVDMAIELEKREYQMRKREFAEEDQRQESASHTRSPCSPTVEESDDGPSQEVLAAMMWAEECGAPLSSDPENLFQLLFGETTPEGEEGGPSRESILEERALAGPQKVSRAQLRGSSVPNWFPGYLCAFPACVDIEGRRDGAVVAANSPGDVLHSAWLATAPESFLPVC